MSNITLRAVKGTPLSNQEVDDNFNNLNVGKEEDLGNPATDDEVLTSKADGTRSWEPVATGMNPIAAAIIFGG